MEKQKSDKYTPVQKSDKAQPDERRCAIQDCFNYCVFGTMSRCRAGAVWQAQKKCKYYRKSTTRDRCMHYIEALDGHCDCVEAQVEIRGQHNCSKAEQAGN
jgi:hypothetical protein